MPPPTPVPMMTPKTTCAPAPAPIGGLGQREAVGIVGHAHFAVEHPAESLSSGFPISSTVLAFLTRPVAGEMAPGIPTPTVPFSSHAFSMFETSEATACTMAA